MSCRFRYVWAPRLLFVVAIGMSVALFAMVFAAPALDNGGEANKGVARLLVLFARDVLVRRTALAAAVGLLATACIFFRNVRGRRSWSGSRSSRRPPQNIAGA